jgi:hypothetical protein
MPSKFGFDKLLLLKCRIPRSEQRIICNNPNTLLKKESHHRWAWLNKAMIFCRITNSALFRAELQIPPSGGLLACAPHIDDFDKFFLCPDSVSHNGKPVHWAPEYILFAWGWLKQTRVIL